MSTTLKSIFKQDTSTRNSHIPVNGVDLETTRIHNAYINSVIAEANFIKKQNKKKLNLLIKELNTYLNEYKINGQIASELRTEAAYNNNYCVIQKQMDNEEIYQAMRQSINYCIEYYLNLETK